MSKGEAEFYEHRNVDSQTVDHQLLPEIKVPFR